MSCCCKHFPKSKPGVVQWYHFPLHNRELALPNKEHPPGQPHYHSHTDCSLAWPLLVFHSRIRGIYRSLFLCHQVTSILHLAHPGDTRVLGETILNAWLNVLFNTKTIIKIYKLLVFPTCPYPTCKHSCCTTKCTFLPSYPSKIICSALLVVWTCTVNKIWKSKTKR